MLASVITVLIVSGFIGFALSLFFIAGPTAVSLALALGTGLVWPLQMLAPPAAVAWWLGLLVQFVIVLILYIISALATPAVQGAVPTGFVEEMCRGLQIGINASANWLYLAVLLPAMTASLGVPVFVGLDQLLALAVGIINLLCVFPGLTTAFAFEAVLGWTAWLMPMNWPFQLLGVLAYAVGLIGAGVGQPFDELGDWWPGTVVRHGWLFSFASAFTVGNFSVVGAGFDRTSPTIVIGPPAQTGFGTALGVVSHETGHTLMTAAFGNLFGVIAWVHERILAFMSAAGHAYGEFLAEGVMRRSGDPSSPADNPWIAMWAPPETLSGPGGGNARPTVSATATTVADGEVDVGAGINLPITVGEVVLLNASGSDDPDSHPMGAFSPGQTPTLGFRWAVIRRPGPSSAAIPNDTDAETTFVADAPGQYEIGLAVSDGAEGEFHAVIFDAV